MTDRQLERRLRDALEHAAPDDLEGVLSRCTARKGNVIPMTKTTRPGALRGLIAACLALLLVGGAGGVFYQRTWAVASVVSLDVNPSIELKVNSGEKVLSCTPLNDDAALVLAEMDGGGDLKGAKLDVAVNAIVGALVRHGYFDGLSSAILISVEDKDQARAARLQEELTGTVGSILQDRSTSVDVLAQTVDAGTDLARQAQANNISTGKAALVSQAVSLNSALSFDQLARLSVEELRDLVETGAPGMPIGQSAAAQIAGEYSGTLAVDSVTSTVDPELDDTPACYEVELRHPTLGTFEYKVDAYTGEVLSGAADILRASSQTPGATQAPGTSQTPGNTQTPGTGSTADIGLEAAKTAALNHAGLTAAQVTGLKSSRDWDDGRLEYEVEFWQGNMEYEYVIASADGAVLEQKREDHTSASSGTSGTGGTYIGEAAARQYALDHAGCAENDTSYCNSWLDYDDGRPECYKVEFMCGDSRYEYEIGLYDGAVIQHSCETYRHDSHHSDSHHGASGTSTADIGEAAAKAAALNHANVPESDARELEVKRDYDDGRLEYEVEFKSGGLEYEYKIDGATGAVLEYEVDD